MKSVSHDASIWHGAKLLEQLGVKMLVTLDRADHWATKGFDGIVQMLLEYSSQGKSFAHTDQLEKSIKLLETCVNANQTPSTESLEEFLSQGLKWMVEFLRRRTHEMGLGPLRSDHKERVQRAITDLQLALMRFRSV